jgi:hypothetical protein
VDASVARKGALCTVEGTYLAGSGVEKMDFPLMGSDLIRRKIHTLCGFFLAIVFDFSMRAIQAIIARNHSTV